MARKPSLPPKLHYLESFRKYLARLGSEEINEDTDLTILRKAVAERVRGLSDEQARSALNDDGAELKEWLLAPAQQNDVLHFLLPFLAMDAAGALLTEPPEVPPEHEVFIALPEGAKVSKEQGCLSVKWNRMFVSLHPVDSLRLESEVARFRDEAKRRPLEDGDGVELSDVQFGSVMGIKRTYKQVWPAPGKRVDYALDVPGGAVLATVQSMKGDPGFRESQVEGQFPTLRVTSHKAKGA